MMLSAATGTKADDSGMSGSDDGQSDTLKWFGHRVGLTSANPQSLSARLPQDYSASDDDSNSSGSLPSKVSSPLPVPHPVDNLSDHKSFPSPPLSRAFPDNEYDSGSLPLIQGAGNTTSTDSDASASFPSRPQSTSSIIDRYSALNQALDDSGLLPSLDSGGAAAALSLPCVRFYPLSLDQPLNPDDSTPCQQLTSSTSHIPDPPSVVKPFELAANLRGLVEESDNNAPGSHPTNLPDMLPEFVQCLRDALASKWVTHESVKGKFIFYISYLLMFILCSCNSAIFQTS